MEMGLGAGGPDRDMSQVHLYGWWWGVMRSFIKSFAGFQAHNKIAFHLTVVAFGNTVIF